MSEGGQCALIPAWAPGVAISPKRVDIPPTFVSSLRRLAGPIGLALAANECLGIIDMVVLGALGSGILAGLAAANGFAIVFALSLSAFGLALRIVAAQTVGADQTADFGVLVRSSAVVPLVIATGVACASTFLGTRLLQAILPVGYDATSATSYLIFRFWCLLPMVGVDILISAFTATSESRPFLRTVAIVNIVHLPLVLVLALGLGTGHAYGLAGAGASSLIAQIFGLGYAVWSAARQPNLAIFRSWRISTQLMRTTCDLAWPQFVYLLVIIGSEPITIGMLASQGVETIAAFRALAIVNDLVLVVPDALGSAAQVILGQRIGARDPAGAVRFLGSAVRISVLTCAVVGLGVAVFAWPLAAMCTWSAALATTAMVPLALQAGISLPIKGYALAVAAPLRAAGDTYFLMLIGVLSTIVALSITAVAIREWKMGLFCVPLAWGLAWTVRAVGTALRVRYTDWSTTALVDAA